MLAKYFVIIIVDNNVLKFRHVAHSCFEAGKDKVYGFLDPQMIQNSGNVKSEIQTYITGCLKGSGKKIFMAPYINQ